MRNLIILSIILFLLITACQQKIPEFNKEESFSYLKEQCDLGARPPGSEGIILCRDYISSILKQFNAEIEKQEFLVNINDKKFEGVNIIGKYYPRMSRRILLATHYDTRPWADKEEDKSLQNKPIPGANDGASGVAVLLEIASVISKKQPAQFGVDLVFFDLEDMGSYNDEKSWCIGSQYFAKHFIGQKPEKAIVVDMIGDADLKIYMEYYSYQNSPSLVNEIWNISKEYGFKEFIPKIKSAINDDHYSLIQQGFNAIDIIDFDYLYWHTLKDTPEKCSPRSLYVVGQTLIKLIYSEK